LLFSLYIVLLTKMNFAVAATKDIASSVDEATTAFEDTTNIYAMIVSSSRYWFNYRHAINALGMYEIYRQNGVPKENIILMIADEYAINARNPYKNRMHASGINRPSWYSNHTEIDYRGSDVTVQMFMDALLGDASKSLQNLNKESRLMIYMTGHGGDQFFKFQDEEELMAQDIANLMDRLYEEKKFGTALFIADTCQAFTLFDKITTPNVLALGTSLIGENAYAHHADIDLGLAVIERWTHAFLANYEKSNSNSTLHEAMFSPSEKKILGASVGLKDDTSHRKFKDTKLSYFFGTKRGRSKDTTSERFTPKDMVMHDPLESLLKLPSFGISSSWLFPQDLFTNTFEESLRKTSSTSKKEQTDNDSLVKLSGNDVYYLITALLMTLLLAKKFEKKYFQ